MEHGLTKQQAISVLTKSPHGDLKQYVPVAHAIAVEDAEFAAHLVAWNNKTGQVKDSKIALPIGSMVPGFGFTENSLASLATLDPKELLRGVKFLKELHVTASEGKAIGSISAGELRRPRHAIRRMVERYLRVREAHPKWFDRTVIQHRANVRSLYSMLGIKPSWHADRILFKGQYPSGTIHQVVHDLPRMSGKDAAVAILKWNLPSLVVTSALGGKRKDVDFLLAFITSMSPTECVTHLKMLEKLGVRDVPALRGALEAKLAEAAQSTKATFKTTAAMDAISDDRLKAQVRATQEKQLKAMGGIEGNWLVCGDKSPSMRKAIDVANLVAGTLAKMVKGRVLLVFFDSSPRAIDVTGMDYADVKEATKYITAGGSSTSIGCAVQYAYEKGFEPDGIAVVSDGAENANPMFVAAYQRLCKKMDRDIPVYLFWCECEQPNNWGNNPETMANNMKAAGHDLQLHDLRQGTDYYALPGIISTLRVGRYDLIDTIMETPLLTLDEVFKDENATA